MISASRFHRGLRVLALALLAACSGTGAVEAAELEVSARYGQAFPFYNQSFAYDPGSVVLDVPGFPNINLQQKGAFQLDASGGSAYGLGVTLYFVSGFGLEGRMDSAGIDIVPTGGRYNVSVDLPAPLPDVSADLDMGKGVVNVKRLRPLSLNLKIKTPGRAGLALSGGVSFLPQPGLEARQRIGLGATAFDSRRSELTVGSLVFRAAANPSNDKITNRIGANLGGGLRVRVTGPLSIEAEARYFMFPKHRLDWKPELEGPLSVLESALLAGVQGRLQPVEFYPTFFQATGGISLTF